MGDLLAGCNEHGLSVGDFKSLFCVRCRNAGCVYAGWATDRFGARVATQADRLLNPVVMDPRLPKYAQIVQSEFKDLLESAMRLEVSSQRKDWEIPDVSPKPKTPGRKSLLADLEPISDGAPEVPEVPEVPSVPKPSAVLLPEAKGPIVHPSMPNVPHQAGGILLGGDAPAAAPVGDRWAAPAEKPVLLPTGSRVRFGKG